MQETNTIEDPKVALLIGGGIVLVVLFVFLLSWRQKKMRTAESWSGEVTDKDIQEQIHDERSRFDESKGTNNKGISLNFGNNGVQKTTHHFMTFKKDDGTSVTWEVSDGLYEILNIGDKVIKEPGQYSPRKQ